MTGTLPASAGGPGAGPSDLIGRDRAAVWHPYAPAPDPGPLYQVVAAAGTRLTLAGGRNVIDGMSSWWAAIHGYRHPVLDRAAREQIDRFAHVMFGGLTHAPAVELAELLVTITPAELTRVFFADSGSVAVEVAIKMMLQYWQGRGQPRRTRLLTVRGGYHGDTAGAMSVCDPQAGMHSMFSSYLPRQFFAARPAPTPSLGPTGTGLTPVELADLAEAEALLAEHGDQMAGLILEPIVQGAGGMRFYSPVYLRALVELSRRYQLLIAFDEIATGFGRTGPLFALHHAEVEPDILCVGKALTGGYLSLAATLCTEQVAAGVSAAPAGALMHGPTFMANPLACAIATANIHLLLDGPWQQQISHLEDLLTHGLAPARDLPGVADVRVLGGIGVVETTNPVNISVLQPALVERGVWLRPFGRLLYTMPPYISTDLDITTITAAICDVLTDPAAVGS